MFKNINNAQKNKVFGFKTMIYFFLICQIQLGIVQAQVAANPAPQGMVSFFHDNDVGCSDGWRTASYASGRLIVGVNVGTYVSGTVGIPLANGEDREHKHSYSTSVNIKNKGLSATSGTNRNGAENDDITVKGSTDNHSSGLPFIQLVICESKGK